MLKQPISSSEIGTLWLTYQEKALIIRFLEYFLEKSNEQEARNILGGLWQNLDFYIKKMENIFQEEGITVPVAFTKEDVNLEAPKLYDNGFDILMLRVFKELSMGMYTINMNMSYREDIITLYKDLTEMTQSTYRIATYYLLDKGLLAASPNVTHPKETEFVKGKSYLNGFNPFKHPRALSDIELGILHQGIESNSIGMQLITGFAQVANNKKVQKYFIKGKEIAKKQIETYTGILLKNDMQPSVRIGSHVTQSQVAPFSDKLMMYCVYLLNGFGLVGGSFGTVFTLRNDISVKTAMVAKDIFLYTNEGIDLMIKNGWMEEPPQTEDRAKLTGD